MAIIHYARNDLEQKLTQAADRRRRANRMQEQLLQRNRHQELVTTGVLFAVCALLFVVMLNHFDFGMKVQTELGRILMALAERIMEFQPKESFVEKFLGRSIIQFLLDAWLVFMILIFKMLISAVVFILACVLPFVVRAMMYLIPLGLGLSFLGKFLSELITPVRVDRDKQSDEESVIRAGMEGEQKALSLMESLDDECHVFTNLKIPYDGGESETDLVVVSPAGVTIVEVKNLKGTMTGDASDEYWIQQKEGKHGSKEQKRVYSPIKQVGTHTYRLAGFLRSKGAGTHVRNCVLFVNDEVAFDMTDDQRITYDKSPIFVSSGASGMREYLTDSVAPMSPKVYRRIVAALDELANNSYGNQGGTT